VREASWPLIRRDLGLTYAELGLVLSLPAAIGAVIDPLVGLIGDTGRRRGLVLAGGVAFAASVLVFASAPNLAVLVLASCMSWVASGAFVGLGQATWMDLEPARTERNMATWVVAGSVGGVAGPLVLALALALGAGWRSATLAVAAVAVPVLVAAARLRFPAPHPEVRDLRSAFRGAVGALRRRSVLRWLTLLEVTDLLQDVFLGYVAVYLVDVAAAAPAQAGIGVAVVTVAGLAGDAAMPAVLRRVDGLRYLRWSAAAMLVAYPAFLLAGAPTAKLLLLAPIGLLRAGWYAILDGRLFAELPGRGGTVQAIRSPADLLGSALPLAVGVLAERVGLQPAMWLLLAAPIGLLVVLPRPTAQAS
jgi:MFS transporter, FSR family, fosmidomycin resistance protein